ncbi:threonine-phosphate decarboxylase [Sphingobium sp. 22B]|uniref:threonine-phosphate decarboxylase n=1 Tax=unclassified Sphingobium TaxID=2611147 RepID=UPI00078210A9|nr:MULTISPECIES: threonine-phosphate decarboxylase [unclassified Sphingobium]KXU33746.1 threonine-phosphate decarboxylase [Sphingobium sp. AM]KYC33691.1 threonine-phosphate decarboxylase [Sphingobium sp. 22B]OAP33432.1 threonine-phosphate decarboxylase [Sphingobium sp. 20006FA]
MSGFTWHGGRLAEAWGAYGGQDWIDLSTGISPLAWPGSDHLSIDWRHLPDPHDLAAMEAAAAACFGVDPDHLCTVPGSEAGLRLVGRMLDMPARWRVPSYRTHAEIFAHGAPMSADEEPPREAIALLLANPNNPDGRILPPARLLQWLARLEERGGWLIVDEAYADAVPSCSLAGEVGDGRRLILLRSFGKFFGLAGVRLGFVLGPREVVAQLRRMLGEWPVSAAAVAFGGAAYRDRSWIDGTVTALGEHAAQLDGLLARHGLGARGECPLFRLVEVEDGWTLFDRLARRSILTRPFEEDRRWLRIGLPADTRALARLDRALADG